MLLSGKSGFVGYDGMEGGGGSISDVIWEANCKGVEGYGRMYRKVSRNSSF